MPVVKLGPLLFAWFDWPGVWTPWQIRVLWRCDIIGHDYHPSISSKTNKPERRNFEKLLKVAIKTTTFMLIRKFIQQFPSVLSVVYLTKRLHIATLGLYRNQLVEYVITKRGADKIAIIYTEKNEDYLDGLVKRIKSNQMPIVTKMVPPWEYHEVLSAILEIVSEHEDHEIEYGISCGTRVMTTAAYLAALITDSPVYFVKNPYADEIEEIIKVQPFSVALLTKPKKKILNGLVGHGGSVNSQKDLGSRVHLGAGSISRHVKELCAAGYVARTKKGTMNTLEITNLGRIVKDLKTLRKHRIWGR